VLTDLSPKLALLVMRDGIDGLAAVEELTASGVQVYVRSDATTSFSNQFFSNATTPICIYMCMYVYVSMYVYIYIYQACAARDARRDRRYGRGRGGDRVWSAGMS